MTGNGQRSGAATAYWASRIRARVMRARRAGSVEKLLSPSSLRPWTDMDQPCFVGFEGCKYLQSSPAVNIFGNADERTTARMSKLSSGWCVESASNVRPYSFQNLSIVSGGF